MLIIQSEHLFCCSDNEAITSDVEAETANKSEITTEAESSVAINVTSPGGTTEQSDATEKQVEAEESLTDKPAKVEQEFTNEAGVTFESTADVIDSEGTLIPYGLPAVYELLRLDFGKLSVDYIFNIKGLYKDCQKAWLLARR